LRRIAEEPVFGYLAVHGDAIEARVKRCLAEAEALTRDGYHGAALTRAASGIEVTVASLLGGQRPSLADYVTVTAPTGEAIAAGCR